MDEILEALPRAASSGVRLDTEAVQRGYRLGGRLEDRGRVAAAELG